MNKKLKIFDYIGQYKVDKLRKHYGNIKFCKFYLRNNFIDEELYNCYNTPLHSACYFLAHECIVFLIERGHCMDMVDSRRHYPLEILIGSVNGLIYDERAYKNDEHKMKTISIIKYMVVNGADKTLCRFNVFNYINMERLKHEMMFSNLAIYLLKHGADPFRYESMWSSHHQRKKTFGDTLITTYTYTTHNGEYQPHYRRFIEILIRYKQWISCDIKRTTLFQLLQPLLFYKDIKTGHMRRIIKEIKNEEYNHPSKRQRISFY